MKIAIITGLYQAFSSIRGIALRIAFYQNTFVLVVPAEFRFYP